MKGIVRHIAFLLTALLALCGVSACIHKEWKPDGEEPENDPQALFVLHISPVNTRADASTDGVTEKIKSLRVIAISKDEEGQNGVIEINRKVTFDNVVAVEKFGYSLTWRTRAGKKDFYIFANEESVDAIHVTTDATLPESLGTNPTLTALLDCYPAALDADLDDALKPEGTTANKTEDKTTSGENASSAQSRAANFNAVINAAYFKPTYEIEGGTVYLPYTTFYGNVDVAKIEEEEEDGVSQTADDTPYPMFLVPVATKFTFHFHNYRTNNVEIQKIEVSHTHTENFLLAQVGENDHDKKFGDETTPYYWVDWLAKVSEESQKTGSEGENITFNEKYGWISDYAMPKPDNKISSCLVSLSAQPEQTAPSLPVIPAGAVASETDEIQPAHHSLGPFYVPESRNLVSDYPAKTDQQYHLALHLKDVSQPDNVKKFEGLLIDNLKALFRNTSVIIDITLREGEVGVYAEIVPWNVKSANGWLIEGDAPNGNLFSAQNK